MNLWERNKLKESRTKTLEKDIKKIDENLKSEVEMSIKNVESKVQMYIGKLVKSRKTHLEIQKEEWTKIYNKYSAI